MSEKDWAGEHAHNLVEQWDDRFTADGSRWTVLENSVADSLRLAALNGATEERENIEFALRIASGIGQNEMLATTTETGFFRGVLWAIETVRSRHQSAERKTICGARGCLIRPEKRCLLPNGHEGDHESDSTMWCVLVPAEDPIRKAVRHVLEIFDMCEYGSVDMDLAECLGELRKVMQTK